jgi:hypothetical protein
MNERLYYTIVAYAALLVSALTLLIASIVLVLMIVSIFFELDFAYPPWSIVFGIFLVVIGLMMTKGAFSFLRRMRGR